MTDMVGAGEMGMIKIQKTHDGIQVIDSGIGKPDLIFSNYGELISLISWATISKINLNYIENSWLLEKSWMLLKH